MKINNISTKQFAGIKNNNIGFKEGINVIYGKNESGKSTLVNLMSSMLFQDVKLENNKRDKAFKKSYFPTSKKGSSTKADYINGEIEFETSTGKYKLNKEWSLDDVGNCYLELPDKNSIKNRDEINNVINDALEYGEGIYSNILLSSQRNTDLSLEDILSENGNLKDNITDVLTTAFVEDTDISIDAIDKKIESNIYEHAGAYWNKDTMKPTRNERMKNKLGTVLSAYYDLEDANNELEKYQEYETDLQNAREDYDVTYKEYTECKNEYDDFSSFVPILSNVINQKDTYNTIKDERDKLSKIAKDWPKKKEDNELLKHFQEELCNAKLVEQYENAKSLNNAILIKEEELNALLCPNIEEIQKYDDCSRDIDRFNSKLSGMNIKAKIKMLDNYKTRIKSLVDGRLLETTDEIDIREAIEIKVPGVMELNLVPGDVDIEEIKKEVEKCKNYINSINSKYKVNNIKELNQLVDEYKDKNGEITKLKEDFNIVLDNKDYEDIENGIKNLKNKPREIDFLNEEIKKICGNESVDHYLGDSDSKLKSYEKDYETVDRLKVKIDNINDKLEKIKKELELVDNIPDKYKNIENPQEYFNELKNKTCELEEKKSEAHSKKRECAKAFEIYCEGLKRDPKEKIKECEQNFNEKKELLKHWLHIQEVFNKVKEDINNNPLVNLASNFTNYLNEMTNNRVESEIPSNDKLDIKVYSNSNSLDYSKLSEGTKETVSLAFRLAVLDHLFPNGGGIAVFDDSLANMDLDRAERAIKIIKKFAKKHQVIFLTCKEDLIDKLGGNLIRIDN